jgi:cyanuric acid amidohydrolase
MKVQRVDLHECLMATPSDTSAISAVLASGVKAETVLAAIGKSEGTGLHDDFGRELADLSIREVLGEAMGITRDEAANRVRIILSGGSFGVISPHVSLITREFLDVDESELPEEGRLVVGESFSEDILGDEVGRMGQIHKVAAAVRQAMEDAGIDDPADVHSVQVKAPSLSHDSIEEALSRGSTVVTTDLGAGEKGAMCYSNDGSALGVALALGEVPESALNDDMVRKDWSIFSEVAATSSGGEKKRAEILLFGNSRRSVSPLRIGHGLTRDLIDQSGIKQAMRSAGLQFDCCPSQEDLERVVAVFAKLILPAESTVRGRRITLLDDIEAAKSTKCVGGALVASVTGNTAVYMSGGERNSHQGPPGGSPAAVVVRA